jgi:intergrase/recombinase
MSRRRAISVYLTESERAQLERAAKAEQRSVSLLARMLVLAGLRRHKARRRIPTPPQQETT